MKLAVRRNQKDIKGFLGGHKGVMFNFAARAEVTPQERELIAKYKVGNYRLASYKTKQAEQHINVENMISGFSVDTDDIDTLLELEQTCKTSCNGLKNLLEMMAGFGGEEVFEI